MLIRFHVNLCNHFESENTLFQLVTKKYNAYTRQGTIQGTRLSTRPDGKIAIAATGKLTRNVSFDIS